MEIVGLREGRKNKYKKTDRSGSLTLNKNCFGVSKRGQKYPKLTLKLPQNFVIPGEEEKNLSGGWGVGMGAQRGFGKIPYFFILFFCTLLGFP